MAPAKKAPAKKAPAKKAAPERAGHNGRTTKAPEIKASRFAAFDSASDEWEDEPVAFRLDGKLWLCDGSPSSKVVKYLRDPGTVSTLDFIRAAVQDKEAWDAYIDEHPVPSKLLTGISSFLMRVYLGLDPGK